MSAPRAAVVIPVWNGRADLPRCLDAVLAQDYPDFQVIAVDDASEDGSAELIAADYPQVTLLRQTCNGGFAAACNVGLRHASAGDAPAGVMALLNQDTEVQPGWLAGLVAMFASDPEIGMAGSKALYPDGTIQHAGAVLDAQVGGRHRGAREPDRGQYDEPCAVDYLSGAALAISRHAYAAVGGLDEGFGPVYYEDVDWCYRVRAAGFRLMYAPSSVLIHHEVSAKAGGAYAQVYPYQRNRLRLLLKHWPVTRLRAEVVPAEKAWLARQLSPEFVAGVQRAYLHHLIRLDEMAAWRRDFLGESAADAEEVASILLDLHAYWPLTPAFAEGVDPAELEALVDRARGQARVTPQPFRSDFPLLGPLIVWVRSRWNEVAAKWFVLPIVEQQNAYNQTLLQALEASNRERARMAALLAEYTNEHAREIGELADEVRRLRAERLLPPPESPHHSATGAPGE